MYALSTYDTGGFDFHKPALVRLDGALAIQWLAKRIDDTTEESLTNRNIQDSTGTLYGGAFGDFFDLTE